MRAKITKPKLDSFRSVLRTFGVNAEIAMFSTETRTAGQAADAVGCALGQIVKSLVFRGTTTDTPVLVLTSGENRVNEQKLRVHTQEPVAKADAEFVRTTTGYAIGGVPPFGHAHKLTTFIDQDLLAFDVVWAAAGTPNALFSLPSKLLRKLTGGEVVDVAIRSQPRSRDIAK